MRKPVIWLLLVLLAMLTACAPKTSEYTLNVTVSPPGSGTVSASPSGGKYPRGTQVLLTATPTPVSGYRFIGWTDEGGNLFSGTPLIVAMNANVKLVAVFTDKTFAVPTVPITPSQTTNQTTTTNTSTTNNTVPTVPVSPSPVPTPNHSSTTYMLTVTVSPPGSGNVTPPTGTYAQGDFVRVTAIPASGYVFDYWEGRAASILPNTADLVMVSDRSIIAHFRLITTPPTPPRSPWWDAIAYTGTDFIITLATEHQFAIALTGNSSAVWSGSYNESMVTLIDTKFYGNITSDNGNQWFNQWFLFKSLHTGKTEITMTCANEQKTFRFDIYQNIVVR